MLPLFVVALAGFAAQLVDGSLGMGYGLTSSTLLIAIGLTPALASASVHLAEIGTSAVNGFSTRNSATSIRRCCRESRSPAGSARSLVPRCWPD